MNELIIFIAKYLYLLSLLLWIGYGLTFKKDERIRFVTRTIIAGVLAFGLAKLAGHIYYDPRPFTLDHIKPLIAHAADNGFPSDHTLLTALLGFVVFSFSKRWGAVLLLVALLVGSARVLTGIHHPLDIAGGFMISGIAVGIVMVAERLVTKQHN